MTVDLDAISTKSQNSMDLRACCRKFPEQNFIIMDNTSAAATASLTYLQGNGERGMESVNVCLLKKTEVTN